MQSHTTTQTITINNNNNNVEEHVVAATRNADTQAILRDNDREFFTNIFDNNGSDNITTNTVVTESLRENPSMGEVFTNHIPQQPINASHILRERQEQMQNLNIPRQHMPQNRPRDTAEIIQEAQNIQENIHNHIQDNLQQAAQIPGIRRNLLAIQQEGLALVERISNLVMQHPATTAAIITAVTGVIIMWFNRRSAAQRILHSARNVISDTINNVAPPTPPANIYNLPLQVGLRDAGNFGGMLYIVRLVIRGLFRR